ncbi:MAG: phosphonate ABC transporter ATP-binding protein [Bauldia litoralis]
MKPAIEVSLLHKTFGRSGQALCGVSLQVNNGEMVALLGASGSGKSTLLRHIAGLIAGDSGKTCCIRVLGETIQENGRINRGIRRHRGRIGFVFQQFNLVNRLSVIKNVLVGNLSRLPAWRTLLQLFPEDDRRRALQALDRVGILDHAYKRASDLSGGQQQRAAIARTIFQQADIVLADEPIASLDPETSRTIMELLTDLNQRDGVTVVVSLHQIDFALRYCPRTVALRNGHIVYDGPTEALTRNALRELYGSSANELFGDVAEAPARANGKSTSVFGPIPAASEAALEAQV